MHWFFTGLPHLYDCNVDKHKQGKKAQMLMPLLTRSLVLSCSDLGRELEFVGCK